MLPWDVLYNKIIGNRAYATVEVLTSWSLSDSGPLGPPLLLVVAVGVGEMVLLVILWWWWW